jgi:hypothetical protein
MTLGTARVIWTINDLSMFVDAVAMGYVTMVIQAERGPVGVPMTVTSLDDYRRAYGLKVPYTNDPLVCEMALRQGARLNLIRTAHYDVTSDASTLTATTATVTIPDRGNAITHAYVEGRTGPYTFIQSFGGHVTGTVEGPFEITADNKAFSAKIRHEGTWGSALPITLTEGTTRSASQIALEIAAATGINAEAIHGHVKIFTDNPDDDLEISDVADDVYSTIGVTMGQYMHIVGEDELIVSIDGGADQYFSFAYDSTISGRTTGTVAGPFVIKATDTENDKFKIRVRHNGEWGSPTTITLTAGIQRTATQIAEEIAAIDDVSAVATSTDKIKVFATNVADDIEIMTVALHCYTVLGFVEGVYERSPSTSPGSSFRLTSAQLVTQINEAGLEGATVLSVDGKLAFRTVASGDDSSVQIKSESSSAIKLGFITTEVLGYEGVQEDTATFTSKDPGDWGDDLRVFIYDSALDSRGSFDVKVSYLRQSAMQEWFPTLSMDPTSQRYFVNYINERSTLVTVTDESSSNDFYTEVGWLNRPELSDETLGVALTGGFNGLDDFDDSDWIGDSPSQTGIYAADTAHMSMDLMVPGTTSATVYQAMIVYCEDRADMLGYGMVPYGLRPEEAVTWRLGGAPWSHPAFNSHRFSLWYGRPLVYDDLDDTRKWVSNLGHLASCLCRTDNDYGSSHAPVGPRRGVVTLVEDLDFDIQTNRTTGYSDLFAENGINYLMISRYVGIEGAMFWEQRTTQRAPSALRELNVVRFITVMNRMLMPILRTFLFEPNHPVTWREIHRTLEPAFDDWKNKYDIYDYALQTDRDAWFDGGVLKNAVINSGLDIDRGIYHCRALIQPTRTIYYLEFELGVLRTGEAFETYTELKELPGWIRR